MKDAQPVNPSFLCSILSYDQDTGKLFWLERPIAVYGKNATSWNTRYAGKEAFTSDNGKGYRQGAVLNRLMLAHRVIWAIVHGEWPDGEIDHINGVRHDNRLCNLRSVSRSENMRNASRPNTNTSGAVGVVLRKDTGKWASQIEINGRNKSLGSFASFNDAYAARKSAEAEYAFHANHGRAALTKPGDAQ